MAEQTPAVGMHRKLAAIFSSFMPSAAIFSKS